MTLDDFRATKQVLAFEDAPQDVKDSFDPGVGGELPDGVLLYASGLWIATYLDGTLWLTLGNDDATGTQAELEERLYQWGVDQACFA